MNNPKKTGNNIIHAVRVLKESYNGIAKLITACNYLTDAKQTDYIVLKNGMICCTTSPVATVAPEKQCASWLIQSFWLFYKHNNHADEVYLLNINMDENSGKPVWKTDNELPEDAEIPVICMAKIAYENAMDVLNYINSGSGTTLPGGKSCMRFLPLCFMVLKIYSKKPSNLPIGVVSISFAVP